MKLNVMNVIGLELNWINSKKNAGISGIHILICIVCNGQLNLPCIR